MVEYDICKNRERPVQTVYLHKSRRKDGRVYLTLVEGYREGGKVKHRTVESLGYLDELEREHEDPIAHFRQVCDEANAAARAGRQSVQIAIHPQQKIDKRKVARKNIGSAVLLAVYGALGVEQVVRNHLKQRRFSFDANAVMRLLVTERIIDPGSKKHAWENRQRHFFRCEFTLDDTYRALGPLAQARDKVVSAINRAVDKMGIRDTACVFYDVTNYYFEVDDPDEGGLRQRGASKEHRKSPIVQMGLLQDSRGIPIGYRLFPGNTPDPLTMLDVLAEMKRDYGQDRVVVVGDKGNNCSSNIAALVARGDGFVYSQSIRGTKSDAELRGWVLSDEGYACTAGADGRVTYKVKSRQGRKTVSVEGPDGAKRKVDVEVKYVAFWSEKYERRARKERRASIDKARRLVANPGAYTAAAHFGAAKYVRGLSVDGRTGELLEAATALEFDDGRLAADEACDGYYCIVTSETDMGDDAVIEAYRGLWKIEESFKVTKSDLETRPVYVSRQEHIEAHFLTCYVALCILRVIQALTGGKYSAGTIAEELAAMCGTNLDGNWWVFDHRSDATDDLCRMAGIDLTRQNMQLKDIKAVLAQANRWDPSPNKKK